MGPPEKSPIFFCGIATAHFLSVACSYPAPRRRGFTRHFTDITFHRLSQTHITGAINSTRIKQHPNHCSSMGAALMMSHMHLSVSSLQSIFRSRNWRSSQQKFKFGGPLHFAGRWAPHQKKDLHHEPIKYLAGMSSIQITAVQGCCLAVSGSNTPQRPCYENLPPFSFLRTKVEIKGIVAQ